MTLGTVKPTACAPMLNWPPMNEKGRLPKEPPLINHLTVPGFLNPRMPARTPYLVEPSLP